MDAVLPDKGFFDLQSTTIRMSVIKELSSSKKKNYRRKMVVNKNEIKINTFSLIILVNLIVGLWNLYLYVQGDYLYNLVIGSLNVGAYVFFRKKIK